MTGENLEDHPALATYTFAASPRFNARIALGKFAPRGVEPFAFRPDLLVPGTFHNSGNRPAPPSEYIPLARRSVFLPPILQAPPPRIGKLPFPRIQAQWVRDLARLLRVVI